MKTKVFGGKKITVRKLAKGDLKNAKKFQDFINSLIEEEAKLLINKKPTIKEEIETLKKWLATIGNKTRVNLVAECNNQVIGKATIELKRWRSNHIGGLGISIRNEYRGIGLGKYLMSEIIKLAKKELKPKPKIIQLEVYVNNKPAIALYKKLGFKIVAKLPKQIQHKGKLIDEFIMQKYL